MATITEDYVSFEVARLLKEKGFNEPTLAYAYGQDMVDYYGQPKVTDDYNVEAGRYPLPTLQMAMKWLREVHNIHITIYYSAFLYGTHPYYWSIDKIDSIPRANTQIKTSTSTHDYSFAHYEKACESAIRYCLENII